jgi:hypothetical protein
MARWIHVEKAGCEIRVAVRIFGAEALNIREDALRILVAEHNTTA